MYTISLKNVRVYAYHGCLEEEAVIGSHYLVNLKVKCNLEGAAITDKLGDTVDYVALQSIVAEQMAQRAKLLETVCKRINNVILEKFKMVNWVWVEIAKCNPPINGDVQSVCVALESARF